MKMEGSPMKKLHVVAGLLAALMMAVAAGCGGGSKDASKEQKVLKVGTEPTFAPFEFQEKDSKEFAGFDMDLARALGKKMGMKVEIQNMGFDALIPALNSGNIDMVAAGMSITDERKKAVTFSDPYYTSGLTIVVTKDNNEIKSLKDLEGKKIAVQIGTTGADKAAKVPGAKVTSFNTNAEVFLELENKGVDAVIIDKPVAAYYMTKEGKDKDKMVGETMDAESYGFAFKKDSKLAADVNKALAELKKDGEYDKIYTKWFGKAPAAK
jgi:glutamine transport system substrate-binding protein